MINVVTGIININKCYSKAAVDNGDVHLNSDGTLCYSSPKRDDWNNDHLTWLTKWFSKRRMQSRYAQENVGVKSNREAVHKIS